MTIQNVHKVPARQWKKWSIFSRCIFNYTYSILISNPHLYLHPKAPVLEQKFWKTTAWNAAWTAAESVIYAKD